MERIFTVIGPFLIFFGATALHCQQVHETATPALPDTPSTVMLNTRPFTATATDTVFNPKNSFDFSMYRGPKQFNVDFFRTFKEDQKRLVIPGFSQHFINPNGSSFISLGRHQILITPSALAYSDAKSPRHTVSHHEHRSQHMHH
jgi:hypothetical protein